MITAADVLVVLLDRRVTDQPSPDQTASDRRPASA
ncbi:hypothetical protein BJY28_000054 [Janibacter alkaliphilus]|uniref:Uncharacterized protein n=1 Tax=Janibacter alkaliphilus TaxID=1069963 RepID=A0A852XAS1_9MICO|nr:hypothetical protein [Janibacter alkaliphilus]